MGSGASSLTNEQKASIAKEMKEKYESINADEQATSQEDLMKHYKILVEKHQLNTETNTETKTETETGKKSAEDDTNTTNVGLSVPKKKKLRKAVTRMRSFENGNFLLENVAHPKKEPAAPERE
jgi:hypothetical protein